MFFSKYTSQKGIIKIIILIVIALLILSYFGYNIRSIVSAPNTQDNFSYVGGFVVDVWNNYLKAPAAYLWGVFISLIWTPAIDNLTAMKNNEPTNIQQLPSLLPTFATSTGH